MSTKIGTPYYVCPEIIRGAYDKGCDLWSVGVLTYIMLCGYPPFNGQTEAELFDNILEGTYEFADEDWEHISHNAKDFIFNLLQVNPEERMTAEEALSHPWMKEASKYFEVQLGEKEKECLTRLVNFKKKSAFQIEFLKLLISLLKDSELKEVK
eukprot:CAMPEP_0202958910 /NCGR_PEP_ID=MMETSP1396-20130829/3181_1 /ASSEMBLY_ACC=CAM_ASM_000872 /TAXON_ID= /ORGANISM="Pseudokeronopsis sp., Strain Brazil" /LENGTH=153 /DNA_ID=CAMNT_0049677219 /DNA_START=815 /DNA_END=1276 /DNA_ORIENTATION=-